jgi:LPXTG-motif cell wall-anchored protein
VDVPETGDNATWMLFALVFVCGLGVVVATVFRKRRNSVR